MKKLSTILILLVVALVTVDGRSNKRGFGEDNLGYIEDLRVLAQGCSWWYNWGHTGSATHDQFVAEGGNIEFAPMTWNGGYDINRLRAYYAAHPNDRVLLGFNEPNFADQSNMTPAEAAERWPALEQLARELDLTLVAPALNIPPGPIHDGRKYSKEEWMDGFIAAYKQQNGGREPYYDYVALHSYMDQPAAVLNYVEEFAKRYNKQVWLTEFCSWESGALTPVIQREQMIQKLMLLELSPWVYRYAWFKARSANVYPYYNLVEYPNRNRGIQAGTLTALGFAYVHMSSFDREKYYEPGEVIPVNEFISCNQLRDIQWGLDPLTRDSVELGMQGSSLSVTYQINVPEAGSYQLLLRAARPSGSALKPRINILDGNGQKLVDAYVMEPASDTLTYRAYVLDLQLEAGRQTLTIEKDNARACNLSLIRLERHFDAADPDLQDQTGTARSTGGQGGDDHGHDHDGDSPDVNYGDGAIEVTNAQTAPYQFGDNEKYYAIFLDETTRNAHGIGGDDFVNMGDNGSTQNSYNWENTFLFGDVTGENSFGVTGNYRSLIVGDKGWSGLGYNVNGGLDLSGLNSAYSLHMAVKSTSDATFNLYFNDAKGHTAKIILGFGWYVETPQGAADQHRHIPVANFERNGEWHNIDIPMSYLMDKFGLDFSGTTDYSGNLFCIDGGSAAGTDLAFDAVFFHAPKDSVAPTLPNTYDLRVTSADEQPYRFSPDNRYYLILIDDETKRANLDDRQIVYCGPDGTSRHLYSWSETIAFPPANDDNSFGIGSAYINCEVGSQGWSGAAYYVGGSSQPLNLTGITDDYVLHFAVKTTYQGPLEFELVDQMGNAGWVVLSDGGDFEGHKSFGNFPRDGRWYNIEVPLSRLKNEWAVDFSTASNFTGNLFCMLFGGVAGTQVGVDAIFIYGPDGPDAIASEETIDERPVTIQKVTDETRFQFSADDDYYVIFLDAETSNSNIPSEHYINLGPNGSTQNIYPWEGTLNAVSATGDNSFGVGGAYEAWEATDRGWLGMGYNISPAARRDLSGITSDYTLHFAVKSTSTVNYHFTVIDGNGKSAFLNLGPDNATENGATIVPIGDFERDGSWYSVDVPVSYLVRQGLDFRSCRLFRAGNIFNITAAPNSLTGEAINPGTPVHYDAVFFYGPSRETVDVRAVQSQTDNSQQPSGVSSGVYNLRGQRVADGLNQSLSRGLYIVRSAAGVRKVAVK